MPINIYTEEDGIDRLINSGGQLSGSLGVIIIGRNEGLRLVTCLSSVVNKAVAVIYVDSGSMDSSVVMAQSLGVDVVELDSSIPFTAARARNAGFERLHKNNPDILYVQFVDGDCEIVDGWLNAAIAVLKIEPKIGIVCGRLRERYPESSVYNLLCDMEWDVPSGKVKGCGGIFMVRATLFSEVGGFNEKLIAGEEPELCIRMRNLGWDVMRLKDEMALHDAAITHVGQWWHRAMRGGHAFAEGVYLHGNSPERHCVVESVRIWIWGIFVPVFIFIAAILDASFLMLLLVYPVQVVRIALKLGRQKKANWVYAFFMVLGKFPEFQGQWKFCFGKLFKSASTIIEYK